MDAIKIAESLVTRFQSSEDPVVVASNQAGECHKLEKHIGIGIEACDWIFSAANAIRAIYVHDIKFESVDFDLASSRVRDLYKVWLVPCEAVEKSIQDFEQLGYEISNKQEYLSCKQRVLDKIKTYELRDFSLEANKEGFFDGAF